MENQENIIMLFKPSLRRAYVLTILCVCALSALRLAFDLEMSHPFVVVATGALILIMAYAHVAREFNVYLLTSEYVEVHTGIVVRDFNRIPLDRITDTKQNQNAFDAFLGVVNINLETATALEGCLRNVAINDAQAFSTYVKAQRTRKETPATVVAPA